MLTRSCFVLLVVAVVMAAACSSSPGLTQGSDGGTDTTPEVAPPDEKPMPDGNADTSPPLTVATSFMVRGQLALTPMTPGGPPLTVTLPTTQEFLLRIDPTGKVMISGARNQAARTTLTSGDGMAFQAADKVNLSLAVNSCGGSVTYDQFQFRASAQGLIGSASGTATIFQGDVGWSLSARLDFTGILDTQAPSLSVPTGSVDPVRGLSLSASEPLPPNAKAKLVAGGETINLLPFLPSGTGVVTGFSKPDLALRYGVTYDVVVEPWADLAGNAGVASPQVMTDAQPPIAAEDGFEGAGTTVGGAMVVDGTMLPPISGQKSVLLTAAYGPSLPVGNLSSTHLAVRLTVAPTDRFVRFSLRPLATFQTPVATYNTAIAVFVPGGAVVPIPLPASEMMKTQQTLPGGGNPIWMGDVRTVEAPLPAGASGEVVFDVSTGNASFACGLPAPTASYLLDDLRLE